METNAETQSPPSLQLPSSIYKTLWLSRLWVAFWLQSRSLARVFSQKKRRVHYVYVHFAPQLYASLYVDSNHKFYLLVSLLEQQFFSSCKLSRPQVLGRQSEPSFKYKSYLSVYHEVGHLPFILKHKRFLGLIFFFFSICFPAES